MLGGACRRLGSGFRSRQSLSLQGLLPPCPSPLWPVVTEDPFLSPDTALCWQGQHRGGVRTLLPDGPGLMGERLLQSLGASEVSGCCLGRTLTGRWRRWLLMQETQLVGGLILRSTCQLDRCDHGEEVGGLSSHRRGCFVPSSDEKLVGSPLPLFGGLPYPPSKQSPCSVGLPFV